MDGLLIHIIHVANVMYLCSYLVREILWLRILTIVAGSCMIGFFCVQDTILWEPIAWNALFILINVVQSAILIRERRPVPLEPNEQALYELAFTSLGRRDYRDLIRLAQWKEAEAGDVIAKAGEDLNQIIMIFDGEIEVRKGERVIAKLEPGHLIGEMGFLTGDLSSADVRVTKPSHYVIWPFKELSSRLDRKPQLRASMERIIAEDLIKKLKAV